MKLKNCNMLMDECLYVVEFLSDQPAIDVKLFVGRKGVIERWVTADGVDVFVASDYIGDFFKWLLSSVDIDVSDLLEITDTLRKQLEQEVGIMKRTIEVANRGFVAFMEATYEYGFFDEEKE